jgi:hypothetical protein
MVDVKFEELCDFNICEEEREKDLGDYKALFYSESKLEIHNPDSNNWAYSDTLKQELLKIMEKRKDEFEDSESYDYSIEVAIKYQITDKTSAQSTGDMEYKISKNAKNKDEFENAISETAEDLNKTFKEKVVIMYHYKVFTIELFCGFYVI